MMKTTLTPAEYAQLTSRISGKDGPQESLVAALDSHDKRQLVEYQLTNNLPILSACVTDDLKAWVKKQGYKAGYTNQNRTARYLIKPGMPLHKRMMVRDVPIRQKTSEGKVPGGPLMVEIGKLLADVRKQAGESQSAFARRTGIPQPTVSDTERATFNQTINTIEGIFQRAGFRLKVTVEPVTEPANQ